MKVLKTSTNSFSSTTPTRKGDIISSHKYPIIVGVIWSEKLKTLFKNLSTQGKVKSIVKNQVSEPKNNGESNFLKVFISMR